MGGSLATWLTWVLLYQDLPVRLKWFHLVCKAEKEYEKW